MEYPYKKLKSADIFDTPYKIKFVGKFFEPDKNKTTYFFRTHGKYFSISPNNINEVCEIINDIEEEKIKSIFKVFYSIEMNIDKNKDLFTSNIFFIQQDSYEFSLFESFIFKESEEIKNLYSNKYIELTYGKFSPKTIKECIEEAKKFRPIIKLDLEHRTDTNR